MNKPNVLQVVNHNIEIFDPGVEEMDSAMTLLQSNENNSPVVHLLENENMETEDQYQQPALLDNFVGSASGGVDCTIKNQPAMGVHLLKEMIQSLNTQQ